MEKILLAVDGSGHSEAAAQEVACRNLPAGSEVRIVSVAEPIYFPGGVPGESVDMSLYAELENEAKRRATSAIEIAASILRMKGSPIKVTTNVLFGSPKRMILQAAEEFGANLIVVGSHGQGMVARFLLGSVSQSVALHAKCSVEIVRPRI